MRTIQGVGVSAGIAIGTVRVLAAVDHAVERLVIDDPQAEMDRFRAARDMVVAQLKQLRDNVTAERIEELHANFVVGNTVPQLSDQSLYSLACMDIQCSNQSFICHHITPPPSAPAHIPYDPALVRGARAVPYDNAGQVRPKPSVRRGQAPHTPHPQQSPGLLHQ